MSLEPVRTGGWQGGLLVDSVVMKGSGHCPRSQDREETGSKCPASLSSHPLISSHQPNLVGSQLGVIPDLDFDVLPLLATI